MEVKRFEVGDKVLFRCEGHHADKSVCTVLRSRGMYVFVEEFPGGHLSHRFEKVEESHTNKLHRRAQQAESRVAQLERLIAQVMDEWAKCEGQPLVDLYMNSGVSAEVCARTAINAILNSNQTLRRERDEACSHAMVEMGREAAQMQERIKDLEHTVVQMAVAGWTGSGRNG